MTKPMRIASLLLVGLASIISAAVARDYAFEQTAIRGAVATVADSVVQINTVGGFERVGDTTLALGPTTGLIVSDDGYIVSSAFNFAQHPTSIVVSLPSGKQIPAELVARDRNRMLVLLKVETDEPLPVPSFVPEREMAVGQWSLAVGRTFQRDRVDTSLGIISALNRMHGRVVQTDANVSVANYGGPLVDIRGRVFGVLVPMSPGPGDDAAEQEVAGAEYYDSGIGFAVPLEHILSVLNRWQKSDDLLPGKLGVGLKQGSPYTEEPRIVSVWPNSPATAAGWKPEDLIVAVNGKPVSTQSQLQFFLRPRYAGDSLTISIRRGIGNDAEEFDRELTLAAELPPYRQAFLGVVPGQTKKDEKQRGILVDLVWPDSPAAKANFRAGDRLAKLGESDVNNLAAALEAMKGFQPGEEIDVTVIRDEKETQLKAKLDTLPEDILSNIDLENLKLPTGKLPDEPEVFKLPQFPQEAKYLAPNNTDSPRGLLLWLAADEKEEQALLTAWRNVCEKDGLILLVARPGSENGWQMDDLEYLDQLARNARSRFAVDSQRVVIAGRDKGGQLAYALGLRRRQEFSGIIADNAPLPRTSKVPDNTPGSSLAVLTILPKGSNFTPLVRNDVQQLQKAGFPVTLVERPSKITGDSAIDSGLQQMIARWIVGLRRF